MKFETVIARAGSCIDSRTGAISAPIYQTSAFRHVALGVSTGYDYTRTCNPTREALEKTIALLENGDRGFAFSSGMAALTAIVMMFKAGDHLIVSDDLYGGTYRLLERNFRQFELTASYVDTGDPAALQEAIIPGRTKAVLIETPTNPLMKITDLRQASVLLGSHGLLTIVDNTFMSPYLQRPLELGADIVIHSGTKYLGGHNDTLSGLVVTKTPQLSEKIAFIQNSTGMVLGPQDSWLMLRGIKTLALRLERQQSNALRIAGWLLRHPKVTQVYYPGLPEHEGHAVHQSQAAGGGAMISFRVGDPAVVERIINRVGLIYFAESFGGVESLITYPVKQTHGDIPPEIRERIGVTADLLRLSVGIEDVDDLIADLEQALGGEG